MLKMKPYKKSRISSGNRQLYHFLSLRFASLRHIDKSVTINESCSVSAYLFVYVFLMKNVHRGFITFSEIKIVVS